MLPWSQRLYHRDCPGGVDYSNPMAAVQAIAQGWQPEPLASGLELAQTMEGHSEKASAPVKHGAKTSGRPRKHKEK
jgi:hypothetical protein